MKIEDVLFISLFMYILKQHTLKHVVAFNRTNNNFWKAYTYSQQSTIKLMVMVLLVEVVIQFQTFVYNEISYSTTKCSWKTE